MSVIEKSVPKIAVWYHKACLGTDFSILPHMNNGLFFLLTTVFIYFKISFQKSLRLMQFHMMTLLNVLGKVAWVR